MNTKKKSFAGGGAGVVFLAWLLFCLLSIIGASVFWYYQILN